MNTMEIDKINHGGTLSFLTPICPIVDGKILYNEIYKTKDGNIKTKESIGQAEASMMIYEEDGIGAILSQLKGLPILYNHEFLYPNNAGEVLQNLQAGQITRIIDPRVDGNEFQLQNGKTLNIAGYIWAEFMLFTNSTDSSIRDRAFLALKQIKNNELYTSTGFRIDDNPDEYKMEKYIIGNKDYDIKVMKVKTDGLMANHIALTNNPYFDWSRIISNNSETNNTVLVYNSSEKKNEKNIEKDLTSENNNDKMNNQENILKKYMDDKPEEKNNFIDRIIDGVCDKLGINPKIPKATANACDDKKDINNSSNNDMKDPNENKTQNSTGEGQETTQQVSLNDVMIALQEILAMLKGQVANSQEAADDYNNREKKVRDENPGISDEDANKKVKMQYEKEIADKKQVANSDKNINHYNVGNGIFNNEAFQNKVVIDTNPNFNII